MSIKLDAASAILKAIDEFKDEVNQLFEAERGRAAARPAAAEIQERPARLTVEGAGAAVAARGRTAPNEAARAVSAVVAPAAAAGGASAEPPARPAPRGLESGGEGPDDDPRRRLDALAKRLNDRARRARPAASLDDEAAVVEAGSAKPGKRSAD
jgi:hypothetical protein